MGQGAPRQPQARGSTGEGLGRVPRQSSWRKVQFLPPRLRAPPARVTAEPQNGADGRDKENEGQSPVHEKKQARTRFRRGRGRGGWRERWLTSRHGCRRMWVLLISGAIIDASARPRAPGTMLRKSNHASRRKIGAKTAFARICSDAGAQRLSRRASRESPRKRRVCGGAGGARKAGKLVGEQPSATGAGWGELKQRRAAP